MNELVVSGISELSKKQMAWVSHEHTKDISANLTTEAIGVLKQLIAHPVFALVLSWTAIELLNNAQLLGYTRERSDTSASQIATAVLTATIAESIIPG